MEQLQVLQGLIERLKHLPGKHSQSDHASKRGGRGGASGGSAGGIPKGEPSGVTPRKAKPPVSQAPTPTPAKPESGNSGGGLGPRLSVRTTGGKFGVGDTADVVRKQISDGTRQELLKLPYGRQRTRAIEAIQPMVDRVDTVMKRIERSEKIITDGSYMMGRAGNERKVSLNAESNRDLRQSIRDNKQELNDYTSEIYYTIAEFRE